MKKILIALLFILFVNLGNSQNLYVHSRTEEFKSIKKLTLLVVIKNRTATEYDSLIKEAFEKYWDYSKFEFISYFDLEKRIDSKFDIKYNVFMPIKIKSKSLSLSNGLSYEIISGVKEKNKEITFSNDIINGSRVASIEILNSTIINQIQALQDLLEYAELKITHTPFTNIQKKYEEPYYCSKVKTLNSDTVHVYCNICSDEVFQYLKTVFPNEIIRTNTDEIKMVNISQKENYTYMIINRNKHHLHVSIVRANGGEILYKKSFYLGPKFTVNYVFNLEKKNIDTFIKDFNKYLKKKS